MSEQYQVIVTTENWSPQATDRHEKDHTITSDKPIRFELKAVGEHNGTVLEVSEDDGEILALFFDWKYVITVK